MSKVRTRFAPSPTGFMHVGNLRSALYTYLIAKMDDGTFILRIEDTDRERYSVEAEEVIYQTLKIAGLHHDEGPDVGGDFGPYIQSQRHSYMEHAEMLIEKGEAYHCFCSEERLDNLRKTAEISKKPFMYDGHCRNLTQVEIDEKLANNQEFVIRQKMPREGRTVYNDLVYGKIAVENEILEDQILIKSDKYPTYNFANVVDDHLMEITHVVRGNEYISSTPKYCLLYEAFGWEQPAYVHLPSIVNLEGKKLSKRNNDASFNDLVSRGVLPDAIMNYLALLGWSPPDNVEIFTLEELTKKFTIERISKAPSVFDVEKLKWVNAQYLKKMTDEEVFELCYPFLKEAYNVEESDWSKELVRLYRPQVSFGIDIVELTEVAFKKNQKTQAEIDLLAEDTALDTIKVFKDTLTNIEWTIDNIKNAIEETKQTCDVKGKMLFMPIRIGATNLMHGPDLANFIWLFGKEQVLENLENNLK